MARGMVWTTKKEQFIRDNYRVLSYKQLGEVFGVSKSAIGCKIYRMQLPKVYKSMKSKSCKCWDCKYSCNGYINFNGRCMERPENDESTGWCSWSYELKPVKGWKREKGTIVWCPKYEVG